MNNEDYVHHIIQKHRLAIALTVIKSKPADKTDEEYIEYLKNKITEQNMEDTSNIDVFICDDDFNISDDDGDQNDDNAEKDGDNLNESHDSVTILENFDLNDILKEVEDTNSLLDVMDELKNAENNEIFENNAQNILTQSTHCDDSQTTMIDVLTNEMDVTTDYSDIFSEMNAESDIRNTIVENINNFTEISSQNLQRNINNFIDTTQNNDTIKQSLVDNNKKGDFNVKEKSNIDSQQTILYTVQGFTDNTHISQSQEDLVIANKHIFKRSNIGLSNNICKQNFTENNRINDLQDSKMYDKVNVINKMDVSTDKDAKARKHSIQNNYSTENKRMKTDTSQKRYITNSSNRHDCEITSHITKYKNDDTKNIANNNLNETSNTEYKEVDSTLDFTFLENPNLCNDEQNVDKTINTTKCIEADDSNLEFTFLDNSNDLTQNTCQDERNIFQNDTLMSKKQQNTPAESQNLLSGYKDTDLNIEIYDHNNFNNHQITNKNCYLTCREENIVNPNFMNNPTNYNKNNTNDEMKVTLNSKEKKRITECIINNLSNDGRKKTGCHENKTSQFNSNNASILKELRTDTSACIQKELRTNTNTCIQKELRTNTNTFNLKELRTEEYILNDLPSDAINEVHSNEINRKEFISNENTQFQMATEFSDDSNEQMHIVSIKTLKELNKVKCYLNKKERYFSDDCNSLDSGFKSSQPRSSYKSASQFSEIRINESAHCLLSFLSESQFSESTTEIAEEISKTLGKLVDKLHEEENYPTFLEDMLEEINMLLDDIYEGNDEGPNSLLERDATIHRLLLLNRSTHIIHYTLEKIVAILEKTCTEITNDIYELKDVEKAENICYIFHILEVILKRLKKTNQLSQMSVPNSQEDRILKKSSLTDMWRKKWNLEKCENFEGSAKKNCILTLCSSVLNKIIVQAMDGYSLISYAALQCFNLLQN